MERKLFTERIRIAIARTGWSHKKLADKAKVTKTNVSKYMNGGYSNPRYETMQRIAQAFEIPLEFFTVPDFYVSSVFKESSPNIAMKEDENSIKNMYIQLSTRLAKENETLSIQVQILNNKISELKLHLMELKDDKRVK